MPEPLSRDVVHMPGYKITRDGTLYSPDGIAVPVETRNGRYQELDYHVVETQNAVTGLSVRFEPVWYTLHKTWYSGWTAIFPADGNPGWLGPPNIIAVRQWKGFKGEIAKRFDYELLLFVWSSWKQRQIKIPQLAEYCGLNWIEDSAVLRSIIEDIVVSGIQ